MQVFEHESFKLAFLDQQPAAFSGQTVLLIHGFASSMAVNWIAPGWVAELTRAGHRVVAFDNRGHGGSSRSYDPADYTPRRMAGDAAALLAHLGLSRAHVMGYSMGARIAVFLALEHPETVASLILGGLGSGMIDGVGDWDPIAAALLAEDPAALTSPRARMFRAFADQTRSDRRALAACIETSRELVTPEQARSIAQPALVAVGTKDDIAGAPEPLAELLPKGEAFAIKGRDHMLAVGDRSFKRRVVEFIREHAV
jgi:pimeloyl-ACP methyl ester carboxylesterase